VFYHHKSPLSCKLRDQLYLVAWNLNALHLLFISIQDLVNKFNPLFDNIQTFVAIHIHSHFHLLALISKLESEPSMGSQLSDRALDSESWQDSVINVLTQCLRGDCAKTLYYKVYVHIVQYGFIIKKGVLAMVGIFLG